MMDPNKPALSQAVESQIPVIAETALTQATKDQIPAFTETVLTKAADPLPQEQQKQARQAQQGLQQAQSAAQMLEQMAAIKKKNQAQAQLPRQTTQPTPVPPPAQQEPQPAPARQETALAALESIYEKTVWQILVGGKPIQRVVSFELQQGFNQHHTFQLRVYHAELEQPRAYRIDQTKDLLGKNLTAILGSHLQDDRVEFTGIITAVAFQQANGLNGEVIITGSSPTILLDSGPHLNAFYNKDLACIARELTQMLSGKLELDIAPRYTQPLPYAAQYGESSFAFLNRLSSWYGEWFFFNGRKLCLGKPERLPHYKLYYARQVEDLQMQMQALPMNFSHLSYMSSSDMLMKRSANQRVEGLNF